MMVFVGPAEFLDDMSKEGVSWSVEGEDRLIRCHGQTLHDIWTLRFDLNKTIPRIPDVVVWPGEYENGFSITPCRIPVFEAQAVRNPIHLGSKR